MTVFDRNTLLLFKELFDTGDSHDILSFVRDILLY